MHKSGGRKIYNIFTDMLKYLQLSPKSSRLKSRTADICEVRNYAQYVHAVIAKQSSISSLDFKCNSTMQNLDNQYLL